MLKKITVCLMLTLTTGSAWSCPFDEAGIEVTILAHTAISDATEWGDFKKAHEEITNHKYLYEYFEETAKEPLYQPLLDASYNKDAIKVMQLLDHSLVLEISELLGQVEEMFGSYQKSRLRLIKAKKHLKALTTKKEPMQVMKRILKSIGNPGLMGIGQRDADKGMFLQSRKKLLILIS